MESKAVRTGENGNTMNIYPLGKKPVRHDPRTFKLATYLTTALSPPPEEVSRVTHVPSWPVFLNDELGDCVIAAMGHMQMQWSYYVTNGTAMKTATNNQVLVAYEALSGFIPGRPSTDDGVVMLDALNYWRKIGFNGEKIAAYMSVDFSNLTQVFQAIQLFGNLFVGLAMPVSAQGQDSWTVHSGAASTPGSWGGHCVMIPAASPITMTAITWGERLKMSHNFFKDYVEEAYVVLSPDWLSSATGLSPDSLNLDQLLADLSQL